MLAPAEEFLVPEGMAGGSRFAEEAGIQDGLELQPAEAGLDDAGIGVECGNDAANLGKRCRRHILRLVDDHDVGKFDLLDEQFHQLALVVSVPDFRHDPSGTPRSHSRPAD